MSRRALHKKIEEDILAKKGKRRSDMQNDEKKSQLQLEGEVLSRKGYWITLFALISAFIVAVGIMGNWMSKNLTTKLPIIPNRYCTAADYTLNPLEHNLKEYSDINNKNLLYLNWYEKIDFIEDFKYVLNDDGEEICIREEMVNGETGDEVALYVTDTHTDIDELMKIKEVCIKVKNIIDIEVKWAYNTFNAYALFEYQDWRYYLRLASPMTETAILDLVEEMLDNTIKNPTENTPPGFLWLA